MTLCARLLYDVCVAFVRSEGALLNQHAVDPSDEYAHKVVHARLCVLAVVA